MTKAARHTRHIGLSILALACLCNLPSQSAAQVRDPRTLDPALAPRLSTATLTGLVETVVDRQHEPVRRARVTLHPEITGDDQTTQTDVEGRYTFSHLPSGPYRLKADKPGFVLAGLPRGESTIALAIEKDRARSLDLRMERGAAFEGRFVDQRGDPISKLIVKVERVEAPVVTGRPPDQHEATTDDLGRFRVHSLPAGAYILSNSEDPALNGFITTYFPGTDRSDQAQAVHLTAGSDVTELSLGLVARPSATLAGRVLDADGNAASNVHVMALDEESDMTHPANTSTDAAGLFQFRNVPAGTYTVQALAARAAATFSVMTEPASRPMETIELSLPPTTAARGHISFDGAGPKPPASSVMVVVISAAGGSGPAASGSVANADWTFEVKGLAWSGIVRAAAARPGFEGVVTLAGWALKSVTLAGKDITDRPYDFQSADVTRIEVTLTDRVGSVSGAVLENGRIVSDAAVVVFTEDLPPRRFMLRGIAVARTNHEGGFSVSGLLPGRYLALAVPVFPGEPDPAWLETLRPQATPLVVSEGLSSTVPLKLIKR